MLSLDGCTFSPTFSVGGDASPISLSMSGSMAAMHQVWQVKDRSDSGCRMRAQIGNLNRRDPGLADRGSRLRDGTMGRVGGALVPAA